MGAKHAPAACFRHQHLVSGKMTAEMCILKMRSFLFNGETLLVTVNN